MTVRMLLSQHRAFQRIGRLGSVRIVNDFRKLERGPGATRWTQPCSWDIGGCRDALHSDRVNQNQGAESSLAFQLSLAEMHQAEAMLFSETQKISKS